MDPCRHGADPLFDEIPLGRLRRRRSEKWATHPPDVLPAFVAEMDFAPAPPIAATLTQAIADGDLGYALADRSGLAQAFAGFAARRWGWELDRGSVIAVPDVMVGVAELLRLLTPPESGVVFVTPSYPPFFSVVAETGRRAVPVALLDDETAPRLPLDAIASAFDAGSRVLLLCNPHNPTGYVAAREELQAVVDIAAAHDGVILSDEIHAPLTLPGATHLPLASLGDEAAERTITLTSASKAWNLAGLKCGVAVAQPGPMAEVLARLPVDLPDRVGHLGVLAGQAAFDAGEPWLDRLLAHLDETRRCLPRLLAQRLPGVRYLPGDATYLAWLDCRELGLGDDPAKHFLEHGRVALASGPDFGTPGRGFVRLNLGTSWALVEEAVDRMAAAVAHERP